MAETTTSETIARELAASQHGVVARRQLRQRGIPPNHIDHLRRSPRWNVLTDEVLELVGSPATELRRTSAAVLDGGPSARLSGFSAGWAWGLRGCPLEPFTVVRLGASQRRSQLARVRQVRALPERWCTVLAGIRIVRPELLALQLFAECRPERAERLTDRLWSMRLLSGASMERLLSDLGRKGRNGTAGLRRYCERRGDGYRPSDSNLESRVRQVLAAAGISVVPQVDSGGDQWVGRVDFRHRSLPLVIEVQSRLHHDALSDRERDELRRSRLQRAGFTVVELWDTVVWTDPAAVVAAVTAAEARCRSTTTAPSVMRFDPHRDRTA